MVVIHRNQCLLCKAKLKSLGDGTQRHPKSEACLVRRTDAWGIALTADEIAQLEAATNEPEVVEQLNEISGLMLQTYPTVEDAFKTIFEAHGLPRLGGQSSGRGWSSFALWQRCRYAWRKRYLEHTKPKLFTERESLAIGTLIHTFCALHYARMIDDQYESLSPEEAYKQVLNIATPSYVNEGWRVFQAYRLYYKHEDLQPLAVEYDLKDPRTGESCRFDLIMYAPTDTPSRLAGTYEMEHKSSGRFDIDTLEGWANDGEVLGQCALWKRLGMDHRFGPLRGAIVNILGKQKEPKFHRTTVAPEEWLIRQHLDDLKRHEGHIQLARATNDFPRSRANCIGRWGRCDWWDHCATGEP